MARRTPKLRQPKQIQCAAAQTGPGINIAPIGKPQLTVISIHRHQPFALHQLASPLLNHPAQPRQPQILISRMCRHIIQPVPCKPDLAQLILGIRQRLIHNPGMEPINKQHAIQRQHRKISADPHLAALQNSIAVMQPPVHLALYPVHAEPHHLIPTLHHLALHPIQMIKPPLPVSKHLRKPAQHGIIHTINGREKTSTRHLSPSHYCRPPSNSDHPTTRK